MSLSLDLNEPYKLQHSSQYGSNQVTHYIMLMGEIYHVAQINCCTSAPVDNHLVYTH